MTGRKGVKLTDRQRIFVECYVTSWSAADAARKAGYSEHTARSQGSRLLKHVAVASAIGVRMKSLHMTADEALARLADHARGTMESFVNGSGVVDLKTARDNGKLHLIKRIKTTSYHNHRDNVTTETTEIELYSAADALTLIGRNQRLFAAEVNDSHVDWRAELSSLGVDVNQLIEAAVAAAKASAPKQLTPGTDAGGSVGSVVDAVVISEGVKRT